MSTVVTASPPARCGVCGGVGFTFRPVLWQKLIDDWQLSEVEARYVDRQQGECCDQCGANLRSIALANALRAVLRTDSSLKDAARTPAGQALSVLEVNEAGTLTPILATFGQHTFVAYPAVDIHAMPYDDGQFDCVVHSDTLEHVDNPVHALRECRRVLKPGGALCFTVPTVVARMSRSREGLAKSFHGSPLTGTNDYAVQTEFGADAWTYCMEAGFTQVEIHSFQYPAAIAYLARTGPA